MALGFTQPLTEMNTRNISWGVKAAGADHLQVLTALKSGILKLLEPSGPVQVCNGIAFTVIMLKLILLQLTYVEFYVIVFIIYIYIHTRART